MQAIGTSEATDTIRFGAARSQLHLALVEIKPLSKGDSVFPTGEILAYDLLINEIGGRSGDRRIADTFPDLGLSDWQLPTLVLQPDGGTLNLLHASCRKLHGIGDDALALAWSVLAKSATDPEKRPTALMLTGDQIYADDVHDDIAPYLYERAKDLLGGTEGIPWNRRRYSLDELDGWRYHFTDEVFDPDDGGDRRKSTARNHLFGFGEYAAMYLLAWNETNWPNTSLSDDLERTRTKLPSVRKALANVPCYMLCDDHEVTDDWNIDRQWVERSQTKGPAKSTGRRIIANGIAAYWAFQAWGNDPDAFPATYHANVIQDLLQRELSSSVPGALVDSSDFERHFLSLPDESPNGVHWDFTAPTDPPTVFIDSRTRRDFPSDTGPAELLGAEGREDLNARLKKTSSRSPHLIVAAATPVFGVKPVEDKIELAIGQPLITYFDRETWHGSRSGFEGLLRTILEHRVAGTCIVLSGDLHYAFVVHATYTREGDGTVRFVQFTSSGAKNTPSPGQATAIQAALGLDAMWAAVKSFPDWQMRTISDPKVEKLTSGSTLSVLVPTGPDPLVPITLQTNIGLLRVADDNLLLSVLASPSKWWTLSVPSLSLPRRAGTGQYQADDPSPV